jgi:hypothetical protein
MCTCHGKRLGLVLYTQDVSKTVKPTLTTVIARWVSRFWYLRGGPLEIPGGGGGGVKIPPKKFVQRKMPGKKFVQPLRQRKKIRASKQPSTNSLEKKFVQSLNALIKILQRHETEKKIRAAKILYPPPSRDF